MPDNRKVSEQIFVSIMQFYLLMHMKAIFETKIIKMCNFLKIC